LPRWPGSSESPAGFNRYRRPASLGIAGRLRRNAQKIARVGVLTPGGSDRTPSVEAFRKALQELGYIEGRSIILDFRFAKGHNEALPRLAAELVKIPVDVIVAGEQPRSKPQHRLRAVSQSFRRQVVTRSALD
jgi:hypothetical protein